MHRPLSPILFYWLMLMLNVSALTALGQVPFVHVVGTGVYEEEARAVALLPDGSFYTAGQRFGLSSFTSEGVVMKFNADGTLAWSRTVASQADVLLFGVTVMANGNVVAVGHDEFQGLRPLIATFSANGLPLYEQRLNFLSNYGAVAVCTSNGVEANVLVTNGSINVGKLLKINAQADTLWTRDVTYANLELRPKGLGAAQNGGAVVCGSAQADSEGFAQQFDPNGTISWTKTYDGGTFEQLYSLTPSPTGGYWATGVVTGATGSGGGTDLSILQLTDQGDLLHYGLLGSAGNDLGFGISAFSDGGAMLTGSAYPPGQTTYRNLFLARVDAAGDSLWTRFVHAGQGADVGYALQTDAFGAVAVGKTDALNETEDVLMVRVGLEGQLNGVSNPSIGTKFRVYPNPTSDWISVVADPHLHFPAVVSITDLLGQQLWCEPLETGRFQIPQSLNNGLYFIEINGFAPSILQIIGR